MNKFLKGTLIALPILVGGYFIYRQLIKDTKSKPSKKTPTQEPPKDKVLDTPPIPKSIGGTFPIKNGDRGSMVKALQQLLLKIDKTLLPKYGADGIFGSETEGALVKQLGHGYVANQSEYDKLQQIYNSRILVYAPKPSTPSKPTVVSPFLTL